MPASQEFVTAQTPMGANLIGTGATFRVWAPRALEVYISGNFNGWTQHEASKLVRDSRGYWAGFIPNVHDGDPYKFFIVGEGSRGYKRDLYARELTTDPAYPLSNCIVRDPNAYPWHDQGFRPPAFHDLIIYQLHIGSFYGPNREQRVATFLDALDRLE